VGHEFRSRGQRITVTSVLRHADRAAPFLILHGTADAGRPQKRRADGRARPARAGVSRPPVAASLGGGGRLVR
jgi:hypothetical protein